MRSCERPRKRSASEALPSSVSNLYCLSIRTHGSSCRRRASSSLRCVSSFSAWSSSSRAASHCSRVPVLCFVIALFPLSHGFSSTNARKRSAASSHCAAIWSKYRLALSRRSRFRSQSRSRPRRAWRTSPTSPSAWRWRVIACRVTPVPSLRRVIDSGPPARRPSRRSRVASPSAANSGAALLLLDILREMLDLPGPPVVVHAERFGATGGRDAIEPGLDDRQFSAAVRFLERELDQRGGLGRVVQSGIDGVGVPAIGEVPLRFNALDQHFHRHKLVVRYGHPASNRLALGKRALEFDPEPGAELFRVRKGAPHAGAWGFEHDPFFDPIGALRVGGRLFHSHGSIPLFWDMQHSCCVSYQAPRLNATPRLRFTSRGLERRRSNSLPRVSPFPPVEGCITGPTG